MTPGYVTGEFGEPPPRTRQPRSPEWLREPNRLRWTAAGMLVAERSSGGLPEVPPRSGDSPVSSQNAYSAVQHWLPLERWRPNWKERHDSAHFHR
jgi:hypothetical protein